MTFVPRLDILPDEQRALWPALAQVPDPFVLYGGTALALRLGHRTSVDFDFFSSEALEFDALFAIPFVRSGEVLQQEPATLTISTQRTEAIAPVKVSFLAISTLVGSAIRNRPTIAWCGWRRCWTCSPPS